MIDILNQLKAIHREVAQRPAGDGEVISVLVRREYDASIDDVWDAVTDPVRVKRWFLPLSGDLRVGGAFQLEGNAGGEILHCQPPHRLRITFGGPDSLVELRLTRQGDEQTALELEHTVPIAFAGSGAGALFVGPGWDGAFLALELYLRGEAPQDPVAAAGSPEVIEFSRQSVQAWVAAIESSGTASAEEIAGAAEASLSHFAPAGE
jgi:uncharacterized protein YndB with AHSA1/START domain